MEKILTLDPRSEESAKLIAAIASCLNKIDALREEMQREEKAIEQSRQRTDATLAEISDILADLKAA